MALVLRLPRNMHLCRSSSKSHACYRFWKCHKPSRFAHFWKVHNPLRLPREETSNIKSVPNHQFLHFWLRDVLRATTACTFSNLNFQKWSEPGAFCTFDLEMCFAPQRRALFRHLNFQKWSDKVCFVHFDLEMCFAPQRRALFDIATSKSGPELRCFVRFDLEMCFAPQRRATFLSHLTTWLRTRRFSERTFRPPGATNLWQNAVFRGFRTFSRTCIFCVLTLSLLWLFPPLLFYLSILSEVWLLNFLQ